MRASKTIISSKLFRNNPQGERAKSGREFEGEGNFLPASQSEAPPPARLSAEPSRKIALSFKRKIRRAQIKKCKGNFSARQCRLAAWRRGGASGFGQRFLLK